MEAAPEVLTTPPPTPDVWQQRRRHSTRRPLPSAPRTSASGLSAAMVPSSARSPRLALISSSCWIVGGRRGWGGQEEEGGRRRRLWATARASPPGAAPKVRWRAPSSCTPARAHLCLADKLVVGSQQLRQAGPRRRRRRLGLGGEHRGGVPAQHRLALEVLLLPGGRGREEEGCERLRSRSRWTIMQQAGGRRQAALAAASAASG